MKQNAHAVHKPSVFTAEGMRLGRVYSPLEPALALYYSHRTPRRFQLMKKYCAIYLSPCWPVRAKRFIEVACSVKFNPLQLNRKQRDLRTRLHNPKPCDFTCAPRSNLSPNKCFVYKACAKPCKYFPPRDTQRDARAFEFIVWQRPKLTNKIKLFFNPAQWTPAWADLGWNNEETWAWKYRDFVLLGDYSGIYESRNVKYLLDQFYRSPALAFRWVAWFDEVLIVRN